jgi:hypothetical protein
MADAGRFPKPVRLGEGKNGRLGFVEAEVLAWNAERLEERSGGAKPVNGGAETDAMEAAVPVPPASISRPVSARSRDSGVADLDREAATSALPNSRSVLCGTITSMNRCVNRPLTRRTCSRRGSPSSGQKS